jgi:hypothetical protein
MLKMNFRNRHLFRFSFCIMIAFQLAACNTPMGGSPPSDAEPAPQQEIEQVEEQDEGETIELAEQVQGVDPEALSLSAADEIIPSERVEHLLYPGDLLYHGAIRLPGESGGSNWEYSGYAMTYYPEGDPQGPSDGYPGSLFALGHDHHQQISEISIPPPVISDAKDPSALNVATTLQPFQDIAQDMFGELEIPRAGLAYLPPQGEQSTGKLYFCWGQHFQFEQAPSHGWSTLDLDQPRPAGPWYVGAYPNYVMNDYLFEIPLEWSNNNTPGLRLATGRFRDGTWSGLGPALFAMGPWLEGDPPPGQTQLEQFIPLLLYGEPVPGSPEIAVREEHRMQTYKPADEWSGGAWLTMGGRSAVIFVGTKATGTNWYGFSNGVRYPTSGDPDDPIPEVPPWPYDDRGWWSEGVSAQILFFDPEELASVAGGELATWGPQPYASMAIDDVLFDPGMQVERYKRYLLGAAAFDRERGLLYIMERNADEERSLIHVYEIKG